MFFADVLTSLICTHKKIFLITFECNPLNLMLYSVHVASII